MACPVIAEKVDLSAFSIAEILEGMSIDYATIYQDHDPEEVGEIPLYDGGVLLNLENSAFFSDEYTEENAKFLSTLKVVKVDDEDHFELWRSVKKFELRGSHNTCLLIFSDGKRVLMSGNIGRYGRTDNVFNLSFAETIIKANKILAKLGLPPFTNGKSNYFATHPAFGSKETCKRLSGAVLTRLDVNINIATGSHENAGSLINFIATRSMKHVKKQVYNNGVGFGTGRNSSKFYGKAQELYDHAKGKLAKQLITQSFAYQYSRENGLVRFELKLDRKTLAETKFRDIERVNNEGLAMALKKKIDEVLTKPERNMSQLDPINVLGKKYLVNTFDKWILGYNLFDEKYLSPSTLYRHRNEIIKICGIDIFVPYVDRKTSIESVGFYRQFELKIAVPPEDYQLDVDLSTVEELEAVNPREPLRDTVAKVDRIQQKKKDEALEAEKEAFFKQYLENKNNESSSFVPAWSYQNGDFLSKEQYLPKVFKERPMIPTAYDHTLSYSIDYEMRASRPSRLRVVK